MVNGYFRFFLSISSSIISIMIRAVMATGGITHKMEILKPSAELQMIKIRMIKSKHP